jgi:hypothetical protein
MEVRGGHLGLRAAQYGMPQQQTQNQCAGK